MKAVPVSTAHGVCKGAVPKPRLLSLFAAGLFCAAAAAADEPAKPPLASSAAPAPARTAVAPSSSRTMMPTRADGVLAVQPRALPPAPPAPPKPDPNRRTDTSAQTSEPANHPPKAPDGKR